MDSLLIRPRRLRRTSLVRDLVHETDLNLNQLIQPYFLSANATAQDAIHGFTGIYRWGIDSLSKKLEAEIDRGLKSFLLFGNAEDFEKDDTGTAGIQNQSLIANAVSTLRSRFGKNILLLTDVCLCPYTSHGHCGVLEDDEVDNDPSLKLLSQMALSHAQAGADWVAPSDMMDGRIAVIRKTLDAAGFETTGILSYTAKYASSYYGPFREALKSAPKGDRASYQMDPRNQKEAIRELELDLAEGADIVMVKPALPYLDIISKLSERSPVPVAAYSVSGEYEMTKQLIAKGMADERRIILENLTAIRRAGASIILTYHASQIAEEGWLR